MIVTRMMPSHGASRCTAVTNYAYLDAISLCATTVLIQAALVSFLLCSYFAPCDCIIRVTIMCESVLATTEMLIHKCHSCLLSHHQLALVWLGEASEATVTRVHKRSSCPLSGQYRSPCKQALKWKPVQTTQRWCRVPKKYLSDEDWMITTAYLCE